MGDVKIVQSRDRGCVDNRQYVLHANSGGILEPGGV